MKDRFSLMMLLLGATCISFAPIFVRLSETGSTATAFWRVAFATIFFVAWPNSAPKTTTTDTPFSWVLLVPGVLFAADLATWHWSISSTTVANSTLLANCASIIVAVVSWLWFGERFTWLFVAGAVCALSGVSVLLGVDLDNPQYMKGNALALSTAVFYGAYIVSIKYLRQRYATLKIMTWSTISCALALIPVALLADEQLYATTLKGWLVLIGLGLVSHCAGQGLIAYALARLPASFSAIALLWQPSLATLWSFLLLDERLQWTQGIGGLAVLAGIVLARLGTKGNG